jgi:hypothetical protein
MTRVRCPTCKREREPEPRSAEFPFCSKRCRAIDLANWLDERYRFSRAVAASDLDDDEIELS